MPPSPLPDADEAFGALYERCRSFTMTSPERMYALHKAVGYVVAAGIPGAFVECGVWRGGSVLLMAETLAAAGIHDRDIYLYDTFDGMSAPTEGDVDILGRSAQTLLEEGRKTPDDTVWAYASLEDVQATLRGSSYPAERFHFVRGKVEDTLARVVPEELALLRLDTDWYESTRCELECLYPRLQPGGVLIIDDYGHWLGARKAVDEYFAAAERPILLNRVDYTGRIGVKLH